MKTAFTLNMAIIIIAVSPVGQVFVNLLQFLFYPFSYGKFLPAEMKTQNVR